MNSTFIVQKVIPSLLKEYGVTLDSIMEKIASCNWGDRDLFFVRLALDETIANAIKHGNKLDPAKKVHIRAQISSTEINVEIQDEGEGFNPEAVPDCTLPECLERESGRGVLLTKTWMQEVQFKKLNPGFVVSFRKSRSESATSY